MNEKTYYKQLVDRYVGKKTSDEELVIFFKLVNEGKLDDFLAEAFGNEDTISIEKEITPAKRISSRQWIAIAASVIGIFAAGILVFFYNKPIKSSNPPVTAFTGSSYNLIETSRGQKKQQVLPDGTRIWLNAASSIRYPKMFATSERTVELNGECYFEVEHNLSMPFHVKLNNGVDIQVTGTHFNVYAYNSEPIKATLLEGGIKVRSVNDSAVLKPGQELLIQKSGKLDISYQDTQQALAWKNGILQFNHADVPTVMRQIERWYDMDVEYEGKIPVRQFAGKIPGNSNINEVLAILELSDIYCRVNGRKIIVLHDEMR